MSPNDEIEGYLAEMLGRMPDIRALSVISPDRAIVASTLGSGSDDDLKLGVSIFEISQKMTASLQCGAFYQTFIRGNDGYIVIMDIGTKGVLIALTVERIKIGLMLMHMKLIAHEVDTMWPGAL